MSFVYTRVFQPQHYWSFWPSNYLLLETVPCARMFSSIPGPQPLDAGSTPPGVTIEDVSRHCQNGPGWRAKWCLVESRRVILTSVCCFYCCCLKLLLCYMCTFKIQGSLEQQVFELHGSTYVWNIFRKYCKCIFLTIFLGTFSFSSLLLVRIQYIYNSCVC